MRGKSLRAHNTEIEVRTDVQFALHPFDLPNEVDDWNKTCVVVTKVKGKGYLEAPKYHRACSTGTFNQLYHYSYLKVIKNATPE